MICISAAVTHHTCPNPFIPSRTIKTILLSTRSFFITSTRLRSGVSRDSSSLLVFAMDFMKVLDQAVREIKREVNLKVLNVPEIEQKVLDATSTEPWGPHGSALSEIAQASKKFTECSMIMNVLWTRLSETGANWRHVYKALTVIEYLIANGSERAVDDIIEHTFKISSLSGFAYVEPNGKDSGINVRKKVETLVALLNDKDKIQAARNKAAANRDKYIGLSSSGITYKSSASSFGSSSYQSNDRYGGFGSSKEGDSFKDSSEGYGKESKWSSEKKNVKSTEGLSNEKAGSKLKKGGARGHDSLSAHSSKTAIKSGQISSSSSPSVQPSSEDDFDPRGSSKADNSSSNQVDLFGESLVGDLMDAPASAPTETATLNNIVTPEVDLFADATFVSASPHTEATTVSLGQGDIDFFTSSPDFPAAVPTNVDLFGASDFDVASKAKSSSPMTTHTDAFDPFAASDSGAHSKVKSSASESTGTKSFDPFAGIPMNNFEGADPFGALTSHTEEATLEPPKNLANNSNLEQTSVTSSKPAPKNNSFQVKSGIWADSLSRGLIDLNITAPKKTNLADIGIVGGLGDVSDDKEKVVPPTAFYMGTAMGAGTGLDRSGFPSTTKGASGNFLPFGQQQFGSFK